MENMIQSNFKYSPKKELPRGMNDYFLTLFKIINAVPVEQTAEVVDVHGVNLIFGILRVQCGAILTFRHGLIVPHDSARLLTTAVRNLNLEPQDG